MLAVRGFIRRAARARQLCQELGMLRFIPRLAERVARSTAWKSAQSKEYSRHRQLIDSDYDQRTGSDTGGIDHLFDLTIVGPNAHLGHSHIATDPAEFSAVFGDIGTDLTQFTFVDLGSG